MKTDKLLLFCLLCAALLPLKAIALPSHALHAAPATALSPNEPIPAAESSRFGRLLVQTPQGRIEPVNTYASELLRKLSHHNRYGRITPEAFLLGVIADPARWSREPLVYLPDKGVRALLSSRHNTSGNSNQSDTRSSLPDPEHSPIASGGKYAALRDFFGPHGEYLLGEAVEAAYAKPPSERNKRDKELLKADEKVNILYSLLAGRMLAMFPAHARTDGNSTSQSSPAAASFRWYSPGDDLSALGREDSLFIAKILPAYAASFADGRAPQQRAELLDMIETYQQARTATLGITPAQINAEIFYNRAGIFRTAFRAYLILGFALLLTLLIRGNRITPARSDRPVPSPPSARQKRSSAAGCHAC